MHLADSLFLKSHDDNKIFDIGISLLYRQFRLCITKAQGKAHTPILLCIIRHKAIVWGFHKYIKQLDAFCDCLSVDGYVIMPNHIHLLLRVKESKNKTDNGQSRTPVPTNVERANNACSQFVSTFKRFCNKEYGENIWQARFNDHIIRNRDDYEEHVKYIYENPIRWYYDELYTEE